MDRCRDCGAVGRLDPSGVCEWRAGCEHRQMQAEARARGLIDSAFASGNGPAQLVILIAAGEPPPPPVGVLAEAQAHALGRWSPDQGCLGCIASTN